MFSDRTTKLAPPATGSCLQAYLLGLVDFEDALALQRRLVYEVAGGAPPCLILCEHYPILTMGRHGSRAHLSFDETDLRGRRWRIRWVNRGGGCWLQVPGQLAVYPILPLRRLGLPLREYLHHLQQSIGATLHDFTIPKAQFHSRSSDIWVGPRPVACLGVAVRDWVTYYGAVFNLHPDLELFRFVRTGKDHAPMTSLERERRGPVSPSLVRQRFLEHFAVQFGFARTALFTDHPVLRRKVPAHAVAAAY